MQTCVEFFNHVALGTAEKLNGKTVVIGGGNVARIDGVQALRKGVPCAAAYNEGLQGGLPGMSFR